MLQNDVISGLLGGRSSSPPPFMLSKEFLSHPKSRSPGGSSTVLDCTVNQRRDWLLRGDGMVSQHVSSPGPGTRALNGIQVLGSQRKLLGSLARQTGPVRTERHLLEHSLRFSVGLHERQRSREPSSYSHRLPFILTR